MPGLPRVVDAALAAAGLLVAAPVVVVCAAAVKLGSAGPAFFRQRRVGLGGREFTLYKLRTMTVNNTGPLVTSGGDRRVTAAGRFLRKTKLDELPQLWNVFTGDMAMVGPRPEVAKYVNLADDRWQRVLAERPGITDPVTLHLRNEEQLMAQAPGDPEEFYLSTMQSYKLKGYLAYQSRRTSWSDLEVLFKTVFSVVARPSAVPSLEEIRLAISDR